MDLIATRSELDANLLRIASYLASQGLDREFATQLLARGICFVVAETTLGLTFAPSRFVGYHDNSRHSHVHNAAKDGRETNRAIAAITGMLPTHTNDLEREYKAFCSGVGATYRPAPFNLNHKFWDLRDSGV